MDASFINGMEFKYYSYNPETEGLVSDGSTLIAGMKVLLEDDYYRKDLTKWASWNQEERRDALKFNRWCTVTDVQIEDQRIYFVGEYDDGKRTKWCMPVNFAWYVKLDSIQEVKERIFDNVERIFWDAVGLEKPQPPVEMGDASMLDTSNIIGDGPKLNPVDAAVKQFRWPTDADVTMPFEGEGVARAFDLSPLSEEELHTAEPNAEEENLEAKGL